MELTLYRLWSYSHTNGTTKLIVKNGQGKKKKKICKRCCTVGPMNYGSVYSYRPTSICYVSQVTIRSYGSNQYDFLYNVNCLYNTSWIIENISNHKPSLTFPVHLYVPT